MNTSDEFVRIPGHEQYKINRKGEVRGPKDQEINTTVSGRQRLVKLRGYQKVSTVNVSRLVAITFLPNFDKKYELGYKDNDPTNSNIDNLFVTDQFVKRNKQYRDHIWKVVSEFPLYEVSNQGIIRNIETGYVLKTSSVSNGLRRVVLRKNKLPFTRMVGRLVARAFVEGYDDSKELEYKDGNQTNNRYDNLVNLERGKRGPL